MMDETLIDLYGGFTNLILIIFGAIFIATACIYFLRKELIKEKLILDTIKYKSQQKSQNRAI
ncbi:MAG: hypothetical protein U9R19_15775 [Bacteroidota bacterium]|nr:hypothetical protein [Bacteroidota bacterium]